MFSCNQKSIIKNVFFLFTSLLGFYSSMFGLSWSFSENKVDLLTRALLQNQKENGINYSFGKINYSVGNDNPIDQYKYIVETMLHVYYNPKKDTYTYYSNDYTNEYAPAVIELTESMKIDCSIIQPISDNDDEIDISSLGAVLFQENKDSSELPCYLPFQTAQLIAESNGIENFSNLKTLRVQTKLLSSKKTSTIDFFVAGILDEKSSEPFYERHGNSIIVSKNTRKRFFGCDAISFKISDHYLSDYSFITAAENSSITYVDSFSPYIFSTYFLFSNGTFVQNDSQKLKTIKDSSQFKSVKNGNIGVSLVLLMSSILVLALIFPSKKGGHKNDFTIRVTIFNRTFVSNDDVTWFVGSSLAFVFIVIVFTAIGSITFGGVPISLITPFASLFVCLIFCIVTLFLYTDQFVLQKRGNSNKGGQDENSFNQYVV